MNLNDSELLKRLMKTYIIEADEHLKTIGKGLIDLEKSSDDIKRNTVIEIIYRAAHSLKGASRAVGLIDIEKICQSLESCFSLIKNDSLYTLPEHFDIFHSSIKTIEVILQDTDKDTSYEDRVDHILDSLNCIENNKTIQSPSEPILNEFEQTEILDVKFDEIVEYKNEAEVEKKTSDNTQNYSETQETIRLSLDKLDNLSHLAEESTQIKLSINHIIKGIGNLLFDFKPLIKEWSYLTKTKDLYSRYNDNDRQNFAEVDKYYNKLLIKINDYSQMLRRFETNINTQLNLAQHENISLSNILDNFTEEITQVLMIPLSNLLDSFSIISRDLARSSQKDVDIKIHGSEIEIDRRIIEKIKDPLIHILRNCIDHGIEKPELRISRHKPIRGLINIHVQQVDGNFIQIRISDDGSGINRSKILKIAESKNLISKSNSANLNDQQILNLIFNSGFSSSPIITDLSGRGLGLAIVKEKVDKLGGKVFVESIEEQGTVFILSIPSKMSKHKGILMESGEKKFIVPISNIVEIIQKDSKLLKQIENREAIEYKESIVALVNPTKILKTTTNQLIKEKDILTIAIVESLNRKIGIIVNEVFHEQDVLLKQFKHPLKKVKNLNGVCTLGSGEIVPVLDIQDIIKSYHHQGESIYGSNETYTKKTKKQHSVLVAEDSITSRMFLKNILESAGYYVKTTIDGKEALTEMLQNKYDILVSDVEMPRMNGFELTQNIKSNKKLLNTPVILVTSLSSQLDKEKGIEVGADAYITKSSFEQNNLLEVIQRFI